MNFNIISG